MSLCGHGISKNLMLPVLGKLPIRFRVPTARRLIDTQAFRPYREHEVELGLGQKKSRKPEKISCLLNDI